MLDMYDTTAPKKATNLTVNSDLLAQAKELGINISAVLELSLVQKVRQLKANIWLAENQEAIEAYNLDIDKNGVFSDEFRSF